MITYRIDIVNNTVTTADLTYARMLDGEAEKYAGALKKNDSIENLILSRCSLTDESFTIIADALIERNLELTILDLDNNYLTPASLPKIKELIEKQLVIHLCVHHNDKLLEDVPCLREFKKLAAENRMGIYTSDPLTRKEKFPGIFGKDAAQPSINNQQETTATNKHETFPDEVKEAPSRFIK